MIILDVDWSAINALSLPDGGEVSWGLPGPAPYILGNQLIFDAGLEVRTSELPALGTLGDWIRKYLAACAKRR
jgi:hypothetical protein